MTPETGTTTQKAVAKAPATRKTAAKTTAAKTPAKAVAKNSVAKAPAAKSSGSNSTGTSTTATGRAKRTMSDDHKSALAQGRNEGRIVTSYLNALESNRPKRGRKRTPDSINKRLEGIEARLLDASPVDRLQLVQERLDLQNELARLQDTNDLTELEAEFIKVAKNWADRKGITAAAWRSLSVPKDVLRKAGV